MIRFVYAFYRSSAYLVLCEHFELQNQYGINGKCISWKYENGKIMPEYNIRDLKGDTNEECVRK